MASASPGYQSVQITERKGNLEIIFFASTMPLIWKPKSKLQRPCPRWAAVASTESSERLFSCSVCPQSCSVSPSLVPAQQKSCANRCTVTKEQTGKRNVVYAWASHAPNQGSPELWMLFIFKKKRHTKNTKKPTKLGTEVVLHNTQLKN